MLSTACPRCGAESAPNARFCSGCGQGLEPETPGTGDDHLMQRLRAATLGDYDVITELGRGGMAAVYLAWDVELARYVAIKAMYPELATRDSMPQRFLQEARTAANLDDHPNVVRVYRAKESQGLRFFVMKYIDGCSLEQLLHAVGPLPLDVACFVVEQVARALHYAHERGVVHRDMKPANVMLDRAGGVTVTDFGIAKVAQTEQLTRTGFAIGTPGYMSPEQWRVESLTSASDQYALGTVAYELLTGTPPFTGSLFEMQQRHLLAPPQPLRERRPDVPAALDATVLRMLAKEPGDRWPSLAAAAGALRLESYGSSDALRARLAELLPRALGTEARGPYTPQSPVPIGRATPAPPVVPEAVAVPEAIVVPEAVEPPATPLPEPPRAAALQATTVTPAPVAAPVVAPEPASAPRPTSRRMPLLVGGALAAVVLATVFARRDPSQVRTAPTSTQAPLVVSTASAVAPPVVPPVAQQVTSTPEPTPEPTTRPPAAETPARPPARTAATPPAATPGVRAPGIVLTPTAPSASTPAREEPASPPPTASTGAPAAAPIADEYARPTSAASGAESAEALPTEADARAALLAFVRTLERRDASQLGRLLSVAGTTAVPRARLLQWLNGTRQVAATVVWMGDLSRIDGQWTVPFRADVRWIDDYGTRNAEQGSFRALLARAPTWRLTGVAPATSFPTR